ncbi:MAG: hypothetical protein IPH12_01615 [Saprospirales bacterium]|nr:hypothetical protein [Saprospirales bacterium]
MKHNEPEAAACANSHCYAFIRWKGIFYRPNLPGEAWKPFQKFISQTERAYGLADAGDAVLIQTLTIESAAYIYRLYRTSGIPDSLKLVAEFMLNGSDAQDSEWFGLFNVANNDLVYFSLEKEWPYYWNFYSLDKGMTWTALGLQKRNLQSVRQVGNLFVMLDKAPDFIAEPDSLYWSNTPDFKTYNVLPVPAPEANFSSIEAVEDTVLFCQLFGQYFVFHLRRPILAKTPLTPRNAFVKGVPAQCSLV